MSSEQAELRAERLRVTMDVLEIAEDFRAGKYPETRPLLGQHDVALFLTASSEDKQLAETCLAAERDSRRREWGAIEALLGAIPPGGTLEDIYNLPPDQALAALSAAQVCGWLSGV